MIFKHHLFKLQIQIINNHRVTHIINKQEIIVN